MKLEEQLYDVKRVAIAGHVKPDGDCVGSTLAVYNYIRKYHPEMEVELHLEPIPNIFKFIRYKRFVNEYQNSPRPVCGNRVSDTHPTTKIKA